MEIIYNDYEQKNLKTLESMQVKAENRIDLPSNAKKILSVNSVAYPSGSELNDDEIIARGKINTRVVFINETDNYDSVESATNYETKIVLKDAKTVSSPMVSAVVTETKYSFDSPHIDVKNILSLTVTGLATKYTKYVAGINDPETETKINKINAVTCGDTITQNFTCEDVIELEKNCQGIFGIDTVASVRDMVCGTNKITVKGVINVNVFGIKSNDGVTVPYNAIYDIDWTKSWTVNGITADDGLVGSVYITNVSTKIENNEKTTLNANIELGFFGTTFVTKQIDNVIDAIIPDKEIIFENANSDQINVLPQVNTTIDVESNSMLPDSMPYVTKVLSCDGTRIAIKSVIANENKITFDGIITTTVICESEEHTIYTYTADIPVTSSVRYDNCDKDDPINLVVTPANINIKARRGKELLIDAKLSVSVFVSSTIQTPLCVNAIVGKEKTTDNSVIQIHILGENETLWDVAKKTGFRSNEIISQNPNIENSAKAGDRVVLYRHVNV